MTPNNIPHADEALVELKPCPFCGSDAHIGTVCYSRPLEDVRWSYDDAPVTEAFYGHCARCSAGHRNSIAGGYRTEAEAIAAWNRRFTPSEPLTQGGWIVSNGAGDRWRTWKDGFSVWAEERAEATRYHRRIDAEAVHAEDEDAWQVEPFDGEQTAQGEVSQADREAAASLELKQLGEPHSPNDRRVALDIREGLLDDWDSVVAFRDHRLTIQRKLEAQERVSDDVHAALHEAERKLDMASAGLRDLYRAYVSTLEAGRDRIVMLGGECDSVDRMEEGDPALTRARTTLDALKEGDRG